MKLELLRGTVGDGFRTVPLSVEAAVEFVQVVGKVVVSTTTSVLSSNVVNVDPSAVA